MGFWYTVSPGGAMDALPTLRRDCRTYHGAHAERSSVATTHARASLAGDFKNCCMLSGEFDGSDRHHFFQRMTSLWPRDRVAVPRPRCGARQ